jgi:hypothetical protein
MMTRLAILVALLLARPAAAQVDLKWKWRPDKTFYAKIVTSVKQSLVLEDPRASAVRAAGFLAAPAMPLQVLSLESILNNPPPLDRTTPHFPPLVLRDRELRQEYEHTTLLQFKVVKVNEDGSGVLTQRVVGERSKVKGLEADSVEKPDATLDDFELTLHVDARGQVTKVEGGDRLLEKLAGNDTGKRDALRDMLSADALQSSSNLALGLLPGKPVKPDDHWSQPAQLRLGALGLLRLERTFTLQSVQKRKDVNTARVVFTSRVKDYRPDPIDHKIAGTVLLQRQPLGSAATALLARSLSGGIAFRITDGYLTEGGGTGRFDLDLDAGRLREATSEVKLRGHLTLRNANAYFRVRLTQEQEVTLTVSDKPPPRDKPSGR